MVITNTRRFGKYAWSVAIVTSLASIGALSFRSASADNGNATFQVNIKEALSIEVSTPSSWASGSIGDFLRNTINLSVSTNNANGFTASMYSADTTNLTKTSAVSSASIPTLASSTTRNAFPDNYWGYSLRNGSYNNNTYGETDVGNDSSYYYQLTNNSASPITVLTGTGNGTQGIYFGAKTNMFQEYGTYSNTVVISVVTGVIDSNNPATPYDPVTPNTDPHSSINDDGNATYTGSTGTGATMGVGNSGSIGTTVYTSTSSTSSTNTTTTEISAGNNTDAYPKGVTTRTQVNEGTPLATGLAITSAVAATTGIVFFIIAKRREDDEDEEEY